MTRPRVDLVDFVLNGRFGPFDRSTEIETIASMLGPSDYWVTYPGIYGYGNVGFERVDIGPDHRLCIQFAFQHPEHFHLPHEAWRSTAELLWKKLLYDWPDSRFDFDLGPFKSGVTLDSLHHRFFNDAEEIEFINNGPNPSWRVFQMPSGVSAQFSNIDMAGEYTLYNLTTLHRWGPDCGVNHRLNWRSRSRDFEVDRQSRDPS